MEQLIIVALSAILTFTVIHYLFDKYSYWRRKNIKGPTPLPFIGNLAQLALRQKSMGMILNEAYFNYKGEKIVGLYRGLTPMVVIRDLELIKSILIKDFNYFDDRFEKSNDTMSKNLFSSDGETWRVLREKISPVFTTGKLKNMYYLIQECADKFTKYIDVSLESSNEFEVKVLASKYTMASIATCAFGIEVDTFNAKKNIYLEIANSIFKPNLVLLAIENLFPWMMKFVQVEFTGKKINDFFHQMVHSLVQDRQGKVKSRHDFMDLLIDLKEQGSVKGTKTTNVDGYTLEVDENLIAAQAFVFFAAGFETSSSTMSFMLYELAQNKNYQDRARKEVDEVYKKYGCFSYEALKELEFLEMVMSETLRKYPILENLLRRCNNNFCLPGTNVTIEKGTVVFIPVYSIQNDPELVPNPEIFNPENYSKENKNKMPFLAFGDGPRNCIGKRFAQVQTLLAMATFLRNFIVTPSNRTLEKIKFDPKAVMLASEDGIWLNIEKRNHLILDA